MTELDDHIRRAMLRHPLIFDSRWAVLRHLYLVNGNGYEWENGRLVDVFDHLSPYPGDKACRAAYFDDLDRLESQFASFPPVPEIDRTDRLRRAKRQFVLDHLDDIALADDLGHERLSATDVAHLSPQYAHAYNVPEDAEESYREGAVYVLRQVAYTTQFMGPQGRVLHETTNRELGRLAPPKPMSPEVEQVIRDLRDLWKKD